MIYMASPSIVVSPSAISVPAGGSGETRMYFIGKLISEMGGGHIILHKRGKRITADSCMLKAQAGHNGQFGAFTVTGIDWAVISGSFVMFGPNRNVTPGSYTATVTVTETYTDGPAGHCAIATETATATIPVTVTKAKAGTYTIT